MLKVCGKVVFVKNEKTKENKQYKRLQLLHNGGKQRAVLYDVTDMANEEWRYGEELELPCSIDVYQARRGLAYSLTYWGGLDRKGNAASSAPAASGGGGKFGG